METIGKIKLVVYKEHTLGYILPELPDSVQILHSSPLKGAIGTTNLQNNYHINGMDEIRLASESDFDEFGISFDGYRNLSEYIYKSNKKMKTILEVSLQEASKAQVAINDSLLHTELTQTGTNIWELPTYDMNDRYECDGDEELKDEIRELFSSCEIAEEEYSFTDKETGE